MGRHCEVSGKKTSFGNHITTRGKAKYLGGIGRKVTGTTKRTFRPNLQRVQAVVDGRVCRVWASVKALRSGLVVKPIKRKPFDLNKL